MNALSATSILTAIAALGSSALIGCANATPDPKNPVSASEVSGPNAAKGQGSCSAAGCGAKPDKPADAKAEGSCSAAGCGAKPGTVPASDKTDAKDDSKPADGAPGKPDDKKVDDKKKVVKKKGGGGAGAGACGAGTCSAAAPVKAPGARK